MMRPMFALVVIGLVSPLKASDPLFADSFRLGETDQWDALSGEWGVTDDGWYRGQSGWNSSSFAGDETWTDYTFTIRAQGEHPPQAAHHPTLFIVYFRANGIAPECQRCGRPRGNYYELQVVHAISAESPREARLFRVVGETKTDLFVETVPWIGDDPIDVTVRVTGNRIEIWLGRVQLIDMFDFDPILTGRIGVSAIFGNTSRFRNVVVTRLGEPVLLESTPPAGFIDPGAEVGGIDQIEMVFNRHVFAHDGRTLTPSAFTVTSTDNPAIAGKPIVPKVFAADVGPDGKTVTLTLTGPIPAGERTTITANIASIEGAANTALLRLSHLPGDINGDGKVDIRDATAFGEEFRGERRPELIDLNRSGSVNVSDATTFGQLWRGEAGASRPWAGVRLPE